MNNGIIINHLVGEEREEGMEETRNKIEDDNGLWGIEIPF